jgi:hypothetical protein
MHIMADLNDQNHEENSLSKAGLTEIYQGLLDKAKGNVKQIDPKSNDFHKQILEFAEEKLD